MVALAEHHAPASAPPPLVPFDLASTVERLGGAWPSALITAAAREAISTFARGLPPVFHWVVLESRLTTDAPQRIDLLACIIDRGEARVDLARGLASHGTHPGLTGAALLPRWARAEGALAQVPVIWLEWDAPFTRAEPLQLIGIEPRFWNPAAVHIARPSPRHQTELAAAGYAASFGHAHDPDLLARLEAAIAALPKTGTAIFSASLRPRGKPVDRLFVEMSRGAVLPWLGAIGWIGDRTAAKRWLEDTIAPWEPAYIQVELAADGPTAHLGIEPRQTSGSRSERRERRAFLERLVKAGRARADKVAALLAWEGVARVEVPTSEPLVEVRTFHLKQVSQSGEPPEVKAYLGVHYRRAASAR